MTESTGTTDPDLDLDTGEPVARPVPPTAPLRVAGFLATAIGGAMMGIGSLMLWATIHDPHDLNGGLDLVYKGIDVRNGKMTLAAAAVLLIGLMVLRVARSRGTREIVAVVMVVAAVAGLAFSGAFLVDGGHRFFIQATDTAKLGAGVLIALAGAVVGLLGAILDVAWSVSPQPGSVE
jgi:hypothetical protein